MRVVLRKPIERMHSEIFESKNSERGGIKSLPFK